MQQKPMRIDLVKLAGYILKRIWLVIICAAIGFGGMYYYVSRTQVDRYSAWCTMYIYNGNPNVVNYQYVSSGDLATSVTLLNTYTVVVRSNKVLNAVLDRLAQDYPSVTTSFISSSLSMSSVNETGVMKLVCTTTDPQMSADICNAVADIAPAEIIRVVGAGSAEVIDYADVPTHPNGRGEMQKGMMGAMAGAVLACGVLLLLCLLDRRVYDTRELNDNYTPPVLASIRRVKKEEEAPCHFVLNTRSGMDKLESYAKLRMNLACQLSEKQSNVVSVTSAISGEGKSTISSNLAISFAMSNWKVLLIDADMRRGCQQQIFNYDEKSPGLSDILTGQKKIDECIIASKIENLDILPAGFVPDGPSEILSAMNMKELIDKLSAEYQLILVDVPPINIVSDALAIADLLAGSVFVVRQNYSDHREIRKALVSAELANLEVLGFVFFGEKLEEHKLYAKKYYQKYYHKYETQGVRQNPKASSKE